ncbi:4'-phosphopantetheinyl transferase family protein [Streptomyces lancefieldiae]|uniref:4'-phosphopantetheinyl transferase superfamily protein n=1 Tax=Streptomyces lancefieldiae TaxID=3075520 RepID=A0ABU3B0T3_9ACTN|nr:4'-phosphopantetheinyl transferase superfamily protein [Streptomyces sp. DSM 40712]MDT0616060.1 4'-phosphopantetheinyl transferase superfamily protein [Streptomyces sp. DSM 40712]
MIESLLPSGVHWAEAFGDLPEATLLPEEEVLVENAVPRRRRECVTVRHLARQALGRMGHAPVPLLRGEQGAPLWPKGVIGSITHCEGYRAVVVAERARLWSVGIDAEPHAPLPDDVLDVISLPPERDHLAELQRRKPRISWDCLLFSAKEAVYKTWFPLTRTWLEFKEARLVFHPQEASFSAVVLPAGRDAARAAGVPGAYVPRGFTGRWAVEAGFAVTAVAATAHGPAQDGPAGAGVDAAMSARSSAWRRHTA